jgi:holo-[acyl-carrier protein] synthase
MCKENKPVVGIGVDMCAVSRMEKAIEREHFYMRIFTDKERAYLDGKNKSRAQSAAAMYAAKEAVMKALGTGLSKGIFFDQIEVTHDELGAPGLVLSGRALERMQELGGSGMLLSLSHEGDMAIAFAVMQ